ncbi:MAG: response regulator [Burkholderiales bacterium]|jgi:CheY-like chemotaxis protein
MTDAPTGEQTPSGACPVLVVDDNVDSAQSMSLLLGLEGYAVECAYDGEEALVRAERFAPEVVLLDLGLPRFSGYEVARRLRATPRGDLLLLVAVSGYGRERDRQAAREAGFDLHITKPADPDEVLRVLADRVALRAAGRAAALTSTAAPAAADDPAPRQAPPATDPSGGLAPRSDAHAAGAARNV